MTRPILSVYLLLAWSALSLAPEAAGIVDLSQDRPPRVEMQRALARTDSVLTAVVYKFEDPVMYGTLVDALDRGVAVRLLCDAHEAGDRKSRVLDLADQGAQVRLWPWSRGKLHAKFVLCDHREVLTGSWNFTESGCTRNTEIIMSLQDGAVVEEFDALFARLWQQGISLGREGRGLHD